MSEEKQFPPLVKGQIIEITVTHILDFGVRLKYKGYGGVLFLSDMSWYRISHPSEVLSVNQKINVIVTSSDTSLNLISVSLKLLQPHPWDNLPDSIQVGSIVDGIVVEIKDYVAYLEILPGIEGFIHEPNITGRNKPINANDFFELGETHKLKIIELNRNRCKMNLRLLL